jgi:hypothetical protein
LHKVGNRRRTVNRIVRQHYPAENLPEDLRADLEPVADHVTIMVESESEAEAISDVLMDMQDQRVFDGDPVARIRALRAEWDWRDEFIARVRADDA